MGKKTQYCLRMLTVGSVGGLKNSEKLTYAYGGTNWWVGLKNLNLLTNALSDYQVCAPCYTKVGQLKRFFMTAHVTYYSII